jgi:two-component system, chemotaxis family, chemotaxis protein CheY
MSTILVVEDDPDLRDLVKHMLRDDGYEVATAANGREALDLLETGGVDPCLVLLDLMMPVLSGPELLEIMGQDRRLAAVPVVVVSAMSEGSAPGVSRFLRKPVSTEVLRAVVAEYCPRS